MVLTPEMLTAFNILGNTYRYRVVAQGNKTETAIVQEVMNEVIEDLLHDHVACYRDDLLLFSRSEKETLCLIEKVLKRFLKQCLNSIQANVPYAKKKLSFSVMI